MGRLATDTTRHTDVLVVGGGPAGASAAIRLARAGHAVTLVERRTGRSPFTRGDLLDPTAVRELGDVGLAPVELGAHPLLGLRMWAGDRSVAVRWPNGGSHHTPGVAWRRSDLNRVLLDTATAAGVDVILGYEATTPIVERGFVRGAVVVPTDADASDMAADSASINCRFLVVADGANSRFGRGLGTTRDRQWPYAISTSAYFDSERSGDSWVDAVLGLPDRNGNPITGHGWVAPVGDGTVNVGVTVLSTYRDVLGVNALKLLDSFVDEVAARWHVDPASRLTDPVRRRTPLGGSVRPVMGPTFLVAGDAAGMANPFNSHGVGAALMTGRVTAEVLDEALTVGNSTTLQRYPARLDEEIGRYHKVGRLSMRFLGRPRLMRVALRSGIRSEDAMGAALRIASNDLRDDGAGGAERAYRMARMMTRFAPSW
ncbi:MAG: NAD(P)/FAD-dependent oxidoreductase [Ilumatobacter sp.]|jgi:menaquinone-9 beta-reductase|uniref:NAD(P)/FAD-dependent oxidoreductase n=1 Tax=Ilumatobacter sp. TaxID=1967498 RepID=UPI00391BC593